MERFFIMFFKSINTITSSIRDFIIETFRNTSITLVILHYFIFLIFLLLIVFLIVLNISNRKKIINELNETKTNLQKKLNFLRVVFDTIPDPIFRKNADGVYTDCNSEFEKCLGLKREEILNHTVYDLNQGEYGEVYHKADIELMKAKGKQIYESKTKYSDGKLHDILFRRATIVSEEDEVEGLVDTMIDITDLKEKENRTLEIAAFKGYDPLKVKNFKIPLEDSFYWMKTKGNIGSTVIINDTYTLGGANIVDVVEEMNTWEVKSCISTPIIIDEKLYGMINIDNNHIDAFTEEDAQIMQYMKSQVEIALSKHKLYEEIIYLSKYDKLTNLYNRTYFDEMFIKNFEDIINNNIEFNLVVFDLNNLKYVNDNYGHVVGDEYIKIFAKELSKQIDSSDILVRYGGDEFVGVFFNIDEEVLIKKFDKLIKYLNTNPIKFDDNSVIYSFSYGIANFTKDADSYNQLVRIADKRMYQYKKQGKY